MVETRKTPLRTSFLMRVPVGPPVSTSAAGGGGGGGGSMGGGEGEGRRV